MTIKFKNKRIDEDYFARKKIIAAEDLPEKENIYLKKSFNSWKIVYPIKNQDGSINYFNLITGGSWLRFFTIIVIIIIILGAAFEYHSNMKECSKIMNDINNKTNIGLYSGSVPNLVNPYNNNYDNQKN